jgi:hypothetical protein
MEPIEPPMNGDEVSTLLGSLERQRATFRWKASGIDRDGQRATVGTSSITLGGLIKHLALCEEQIFRTKLLNEPYGEPWHGVDWASDPDWEWRTGASDDPIDLWRLWDAAVARSRRIVDEALAVEGLETLSKKDWNGERASLRRLLIDLIEEYARHVGHADLIRESVDGLVGEDPW